MKKLFAVMLVALLFAAVLLAGCVTPPEGDGGEDNYTYEEPDEDIPMPTQEDLERAESPELPF